MELLKKAGSIVILSIHMIFASDLAPISHTISREGVQDGASEKETPEPWMIEEAKRVLSICPEKALYARIDAVRQKDRLRVMEVELIEPHFYSELEEGFSNHLFLEILSCLLPKNSFKRGIL